MSDQERFELYANELKDIGFIEPKRVREDGQSESSDVMSEIVVSRNYRDGIPKGSRLPSGL